MSDSRYHPTRAVALLWVIGLACAALTLRVLNIQWFSRDHYLSIAVSPPGRTCELRGLRGRILDRQYRVLADSVTATCVYADPLRVQESAVQAAQDALGRQRLAESGGLKWDPGMQRVATAVAASLALPFDEVLERLCRQTRYVVLAPRADADRAAQLETLNIPGLYFGAAERREYPYDSLAASVLGYCDAQQRPVGGVERWYRQITEGQTLALPMWFDAWGRQIICRGVGMRPRPRAGKDLVLTIDLDIQQTVEQVLDECMAVRQPEGANAVVMSCHDGSILAMSCRPTFNPNEISKARGMKAPVPAHALRNRAVGLPMEPGSTFKLLTVAAGLETGVITPHTSLRCLGRQTIVGRSIACWGEWGTPGRGHGLLTPRDVLAKSCNLCAAQIALRVKTRRFISFLQRCGIGQLPCAGFPDESPGNIPDPQRLRDCDLACIGFGQGILVSDLQLAAAACALFNGGLLYQPHVVEGYISPEDNETYVVEPRVLRRVCSETTSAFMREFARHVVENGTGRPAQIPGVAVGGKTATAQIFDRELGRYLQGAQDHVMSFLLAAPMDRKPDFVVLVTVERPKVGRHGSDVAAPYARRIAESILTQPVVFPRWETESVTTPPDDNGDPA